MMQNWRERLFRIRRPATKEPLAPGLYHAMREADGMLARFHLRVERDGSGLLIANAAATARLSATGALIAKGLLDGVDESNILKTLSDHFRGASEAVMLADIAKVKALITQLAAPGDTYPVFNLEDAALSPYSSELIAPLQASLPLAAPTVVLPILDRLWDIGIPHVTLHVPPAFDREHLIRAVERAEDLGMIAGVRGRAGDLLIEGLLPDLAVAGVDHVTFLYASIDPEIHDGLVGAGDHAAAMNLLNWLEENEICAVAEIPLVYGTLFTLDETVEALIPAGADNLSFVAYATTDETLAISDDGALLGEGLPQIATIVEEAANEIQARFIWEPPVQRNPEVALAVQVQQGPRCAGDVAVRVEHDGSVIPPRGPYHSAGNLLTTPWETIWNDEAFRVYRERVESPTRCSDCPGLTICAADCPRKPSGWAQAA